MDFGGALTSLKSGKRVARPSRQAAGRRLTLVVKWSHNESGTLIQPPWIGVDDIEDGLSQWSPPTMTCWRKIGLR